MSDVFVIAEAGSNHNGSIDIAKHMIDVAVEAQADAVKFQIFKSDTLYSRNTPDFAQYHDIPGLIKSLEFDREWAWELKEYCDRSGIEFMATPFDEDAIDLLVSLGVKRMKIAGFEASDPRFVDAVMATNLPTIISLGSGLNSSNVFKILNDANWPANITFLHCNNAYPTPDTDANLLEMKRLVEAKHTLKRDIGLDIGVGLSDHTEGILAPPIAVVLGAKVIEKHFTLDRRMNGPDHAFAIEPRELKDMVTAIRRAEAMIGTEKSGYTESEKGYRSARRSVVLTKDVKVGEIITDKNVTTKRPFVDGAVPASAYYSVLGQAKFTKNLKRDDILLLEDISWRR